MKRIILATVICLVACNLCAQDKLILLDDLELTGYAMRKALNEDGSGFIERPYKWYSGIGKADDRQIALEIAQREAYATISRIIGNIVEDKCAKASLVVDGKVKSAIRSYWKQVSENITKGCEPFGKASVEYDMVSQMYVVTAKVAVRGDRFLKMLGETSSFNKGDLNKEEIEECIEINNAIIAAATGE